MSGIYIKGFEMPTNEPLIVKINPDGSVSTTWKNNYKKYEAVHVPEHGDLIDRDALEKDIDNYIGGEESRSRFHHWVQIQSVVIPGDKGEET